MGTYIVTVQSCSQRADYSKLQFMPKLVFGARVFAKKIIFGGDNFVVYVRYDNFENSLLV